MKLLVGEMYVSLVVLHFSYSAIAYSQTAQLESKKDGLSASWEGLPTRTLKPRQPPDDWTRQSDDDHSVTWFSPSATKKTVTEGEPPKVIYDSQDGTIRISLCCVRTNTRFQGSPKLFLDSMDEAMLRSFKRNGINGIPRPVEHVKYLNAIGRILRIDVPGRKTALKCDLTTPTQCYSVIAIGEPGEKLNAVFERFVTSIQITTARQESGSDANHH